MSLQRKVLLLLVFILGTMLLAGCATKSNNGDPGNDGRPADQGQEQPANNDNEQKTALQIYFVRDNQGPVAVPVTREVALAGDDPAEMAKKAVELLQTGSTAEEKEQGLFSNLPEAELLEVTVQRPYITLNFSEEFAQVGGTYRVSAIVEQLAYTMSAIPGIKAVILQVEGRQVGTEENPFTGEGLLFDKLTINPAGEETASLGPADALDLFIAVIPDTEKMWAMMGPRAREIYKQPSDIEYAAFSEGLGSWRDYEVTEEKIEGDMALVTIRGDQVLEGMEQPDATYTAYMVKENGRWKWDFPPAD